MLRVPKVGGDIEDESYMLISKVRLTRNEYNATVRNKIEYNRLKVLNRYMSDQNDLEKYKLRSTMYDIKHQLDENQRVVCNVNEYFISRKAQPANPYGRSQTAGVRSDPTRRTRENRSTRAKSASTTYRPLTAPSQTLSDESYIDHEDTDSDDDDVVPISDSRLTSAKQQSSDRFTSGTLNSFVSHQSSDLPFDNTTITTSNVSSSSLEPSSYRITWPVRLRVFAVQDEDEHRQQFLAWRAEQRTGKPRRTSKQLYDTELERKYRESIRRRIEIESYATPQAIAEHQSNDPVFAKRYRQLKLAIRAGKTPIYDPNDREIHVTTNKSKIERTRTALITAKQNRVKTFYQNQQKINDAKLSKRVDHFLKRLDTFKQEQEEQHEEQY